MALLMTVLGVIGVLAGAAGLLWLTAVVEARQLGPVVRSDGGPATAAETVLEVVQAA